MLCRSPVGDWQLVLTMTRLSQLSPGARVACLRLWWGLSAGSASPLSPACSSFTTFLGWVGFCVLCVPHTCILALELLVSGQGPSAGYLTLPFRAVILGRQFKSLDANHAVKCERSMYVRVGLGVALGLRAPESHLHRHASQWRV